MEVCVYGLEDLVPREAAPAGWELANGLPRI